MDRFVVSTGRCGSTLVSRMLAEHPAVLSAAEIFSMAQPGAFPSGALDGERFWRVISEPRAEMSLLLRERAEPGEVLYPVDGPGRFDRESGVPPIALICLPSLTEDPDALYEELEAPVRRFEPARAGDLYRKLLELLATILGKQAWVERSGGSLGYVADLVEQFERPKLLHIYRDGPDTAFSMSRHGSYRIAMVRTLLEAELGRDPFESGDDVARAFREMAIPVERYGRVWSATILQGVRRLSALPAGDVRHVSYERLVADPKGELPQVAELFELPDPRGPWLERAATVVREPEATASSALTDDELERLRRACAAGERRLRKLEGSGT